MRRERGTTSVAPPIPKLYQLFRTIRWPYSLMAFCFIMSMSQNAQVTQLSRVEFNCCRLQSEDVSFCLNVCCSPLSGDEKGRNCGRKKGVVVPCPPPPPPPLCLLSVWARSSSPAAGSERCAHLSATTPHCSLSAHLTPISHHPAVYQHLSTLTTPHWIIVASKPNW